MGLPSVIINFKETGTSAIKRGQRGIVAVVLKDDVEEIESHEVLTVADIHPTLNEFNQNQVQLALMGYQTPPKKVQVVVIPQEQESYSEVMKYLEILRWDYLAIPQIEQKDVSVIASWIKSLNETLDKKVKAVLPNCKADHESIINFTTVNIALYDMYKVLQEKIAAEGVEVTIEQIDRRFSSNKPIIRTEKGDFNLEEHLVDAIGVCRDIIKDIENKFGKTVLHDKVFVGGGAEKFLNTIDGKVRNNVEVPNAMRWYGNCRGYLLNI